MPTTTHNFDAGRPQFLPSCEHHVGERPWAKEHGLGFCNGCKGWVELDGWGRIPEHEPAPPTIQRCPYCGRPYQYLSYTDPRCDRCVSEERERELLEEGLTYIATMMNEIEPGTVIVGEDGALYEVVPDEEATPDDYYYED